MVVELIPPNLADEANHFWLAPFRSQMEKRNKRDDDRRHKTRRGVAARARAVAREVSTGGGQGGLEASMEGVEGGRCGVARERPNMAGGGRRRGDSWGSGSGGIAGGASKELDGTDHGGPEGTCFGIPRDGEAGQVRSARWKMGRRR
jgi:hypothetical protein